VVDMMQPLGASYKVQRRVAGHNNIRLDGIMDLVIRAKGKTVFDIGCNRGMVGYQFAEQYASLVHGCDLYEDGIKVAREVFADLRSVESRFEVVDLTQGPKVLDVFEMSGYDIVLCLAVFHKLKRVMTEDKLIKLMQFFGNWTKKYFAWRGTSDKPDENEQEIKWLDRNLKPVGLQRIHTSYISNDLGVAAIWGR
jgi:cyclopropane fatty-acyl-phospholipid synthase-like methyltransferase